MEWLFGIEPAEEDDDNRMKWEARQRRLHKLITEKQPIPRSPKPPTEPEKKGKQKIVNTPLVRLQLTSAIMTMFGIKSYKNSFSKFFVLF